VHIGIIVNPRSGRNKAAILAQQCDVIARSRGHTTIVLQTDQQGNAEFKAQLKAMDRLIFVGGDGTVHHSLPQLIEHQTPFIHLATGTSNLISKELSMPKKPDEILDWIEQGGVAKIDVPTLDTVPFLIMANFGMDASVIHRFESARRKSGGFRNYVQPIIREMLRPGSASLMIHVDGKPLAPQRRTNLTLANMKSYALQINPCPHADPADSKIDLLASNCSTSIAWSLNTNLCRLRIKPPSSITAKGTSVTIESLNRPSPAQFDGEIAITPTMPDGILHPGQAVELLIGQHQIQYITKPVP